MTQRRRLTGTCIGTVAASLLISVGVWRTAGGRSPGR